MRKIIIGFFVISIYLLGNQLQWDCTDKVAKINYEMKKAKKLSNPEKTTKLKDLLITIYEVSDECKSTDTNKDFDLDGSDYFGTDNLKVGIKKIINGDVENVLEPTATDRSITEEGKFISYDYNMKWGIFEINGYQTELMVDSPERLTKHKNEALKIKYDPEAGVIYDIYFQDSTSLNGTKIEATNVVQKNKEDKMLVKKSSVTVKGSIIFGTLDSAISSDNGEGVGFITDSDIGNHIFSVCKVGDSCEVTGITDDNGFLVSVYSVKKVQNSYSTSNNINNNINKKTCSQPHIKQTVKKLIVDGIIKDMYISSNNGRRTYTLEEARMIRDPELSSVRIDGFDEYIGKILCAGTIKFPRLRAIEVNYTVQKTDDGQDYINVNWDRSFY